jgi:hypothetical protein
VLIIVGMAIAHPASRGTAVLVLLAGFAALAAASGSGLGILIRRRGSWNRLGRAAHWWWGVGAFAVVGGVHAAAGMLMFQLVR